jgi:hypothetical protein
VSRSDNRKLRWWFSDTATITGDGHLFAALEHSLWMHRAGVPNSLEPASVCQTSAGNAVAKCVGCDTAHRQVVDLSSTSSCLTSVAVRLAWHVEDAAEHLGGVAHRENFP